MFISLVDVGWFLVTICLSIVLIMVARTLNSFNKILLDVKELLRETKTTISETNLILANLNEVTSTISDLVIEFKKMLSSIIEKGMKLESLLEKINFIKAISKRNKK